MRLCASLKLALSSNYAAEIFTGDGHRLAQDSILLYVSHFSTVRIGYIRQLWSIWGQSWILTLYIIQ